MKSGDTKVYVNLINSSTEKNLNTKYTISIEGLKISAVEPEKEEDKKTEDASKDSSEKTEE